MIERWAGAVRPLVDGERALADVRAIARYHRIQASPGYDEAAGWLTGALADAGLEHQVEHAPGDGRTNLAGCALPEGWSITHAEAHLHGAAGREPLADFAADPLSLVQRSSPVTGRFPLAALDDGTRAEHYEAVDVRGCVVLTAGAVGRVHQLAVVERGAAGMLAYGRRLVPPARTREHDRDSLAYTSFWWGGDEPRGWGFVLGPARGEALAARLASGEWIEVEARIESARGDTRVPLVTATLPGTLPGEVLLTAHLCHPRPGANDNASGVASVLEAMRALSALAAAGRLPAARRTIRALWMPEFTGTYAWLAGGPARAERTVAALNLDMVGEDQLACGSEQLLERAPHFAGSFADELARLVRLATHAPGDGALRAREVPYSGGSDHAVWLDPAVGVPCPLVIQWPDRYYHSNLDGPGRCDARSLAHAARIGAAYAAIAAMADADTVAWLAAQVERTAVREMRTGLDAANPDSAVRAARLRGQQALASLARFAPAVALAEIERAIAPAVEALEGAFESEILAVRPGAGRVPAAAACPRVPVRLQRTLLAPMRSLQPGWLALPKASRERWAQLDREMPGGGTTLDLAWFACDGRRTVDEIAACIADEGTDVDARMLETYFELATELGAAAWR